MKKLCMNFLILRILHTFSSPNEISIDDDRQRVERIIMVSTFRHSNRWEDAFSWSDDWSKTIVRIPNNELFWINRNKVDLWCNPMNISTPGSGILYFTRFRYNLKIAFSESVFHLNLIQVKVALHNVFWEDMRCTMYIYFRYKRNISSSTSRSVS